uniref:Uncharacterized protein n=1 Tax=Ditylenchus dipsaci TaxID=166011 RepID=A0A915DEB6_9BILA
MVLDKNLNKCSLKQQSIFPDEEDSDEASCSNFSRSTEDGKTPAVAPLDYGESIRLKKLQQWKRTSILFRTCKVLRCDPLQKFTTQRTCTSCSKILSSEYKKMCLTWKRKTLRHAILDYLYFHTIRVFDSDAEETFSRENPDYHYLVCYKKVREFNALLVNSLGTAYQFDLPIRAAVKEHSKMYCDILKTSTRICEICDSVAKKNLC